jgi:hypothetical protein
VRDIARKTTWAFGGTNYDTELQAIDANLKALGRKIVKEYATEPAAGLVKYGDEIAPLLTRRAELRAMDELPADSLEGTRSGEPEGTRERRTRAPSSGCAAACKAGLTSFPVPSGTTTR